mmetsp:Transcript_4583/g.7324  ORF Transcript_4583/g.7324 Transcript_4583/m.7324 type:complete len:110 (-) Transcript_4583:816-1145(-)
MHELSFLVNRKKPAVAGVMTTFPITNLRMLVLMISCCIGGISIFIVLGVLRKTRIVGFKANAIIKINCICSFHASGPLSEFNLSTEYDIEIACHQGMARMLRLIFDTFW